jgi:hypothetical protein
MSAGYAREALHFGAQQSTTQIFATVNKCR